MFRTSRNWTLVLTVFVLLTLVASACTSTATPTPAPKAEPTKPAAAPTTAPAAPKTEAPKAEAPKPAAEAPKPAAAPAAAAKPAGKAIKFGELEPMTGGLAVGGKMAAVAVQLAAEEINKTGGINGSPVEVVTLDTRADPKEAVTAFRKLVSEDVAGVIGPFSTGELRVVGPLSNEFKIPTLSHASSFGVARENRPYVYQINTQSPVWWPKGVDVFMKKYPQVKKVTLVRDNKYAAAQYDGQTLLPGLLKEKGLQVVGTADYETGQKDWAVTATQIKEQGAAGIVVAGLYTDGPGMMKELERLGYSGKMLLSPMFFQVNMVWTTPKILEGAVMPFWTDWTGPDPKLQGFVKSWTDKMMADPAVQKPPAGGYNWFPSHELTDYDALMAMADISRKAGINGNTPAADARAKIQAGYQNLKDFPGLVGKITVTKDGEVTWDTPVFIIENGAPKAIK